MLLLLLSLNVQAQDKKVQKGIERYEFKAYSEAIDMLGKALEESNGQDMLALRYLAYSYRKTNDYINAESYYQLLVNSDSVIAEDHYYYGQALRANGKLVEANEQFQKYAEESDNQFLVSLVTQSIDEVYKWEVEGSRYKSEYDAKLNSELSEFNLLHFKDKYYITSNRIENYNSPESFDMDGSPFLSILEVDEAEFNAEFPEFREVSGKMNTAYHDGPLAIDPNHERVLITRIDNRLGGKNFENKMKLYEGRYVDGKWKNFKALPFNSDDYHVAHACYADSGNTIIFASDMPDGYGGMDLYASKKENGEWQSPKSLGPVINSKLDEIFPYVKDGKLYFSSNGQTGYGGLDLFVSEFDMAWQKPLNLRSPMNSSRDDFGISFITDSTGYFASNRTDGKGKDDIYRFSQSKEIQTVGITGVFEYKGLPVDGEKVLLVDENDSIIAVAYTDKDGKFNFKNLAYQDDYLVRIDAEDTELIHGGKLYLTDQEGEKVKLIERLQDGTFKFRALPAQEMKPDLIVANDLDSLPEDPYIRGNLYKKLPGDYEDSLKVYLVDDAGSIVDSTYSDLEGNFKFSKLELDDNSKYFVQVDAEDDDISVAYVNQKNRIYSVVQSNDNTYQLANDLDPSEQPTLTSDKGITGIVARLELDGKPLPYARVQIYDESNNLIGTVITNEFGEFQYNKLNVDDKYFFKLSEVPDAELENAFIYVTDIHGDPLYLIHKLQDNSFEFRALPFDKYSDVQLLEEASVPDLIDLNGVVFKKLAGDLNQAQKIYLLDADGNIVDSTYTGLDGDFKFKQLKADQNYFFKLENPEELNLALYNEEKKIIEQTTLNEDNNFQYKKLTYMVAQFNQEEITDPALVEVIDLEFYGQIFKKLPGDYEEGMKVLIYDEDGNLVGESYTDKDGRFKYKKLKAEETYVFKIDEDDVEYQVATLDQDGKVLSKILKNENGEFEYKTLSLDQYKTSLMDADDLLAVSYEDPDVEVYGQVFRKLPGDYREGMKIMIFDLDGNYIGRTHTDKEGKFKYSKLKAEETYVFKIEGENGNYQIITLDKNGRVLSKVIKNENGEFTYKALPLDGHGADELTTDDSAIKGYKKDPATGKKEDIRLKDVAYTVPKGTYLVFYRFDSTNINQASKKVVRALLKEIRNSNSMIEIDSHTDNRGPNMYNEDLSRRRTDALIDFLVRNGIEKERIVGRYSGEGKPVIDCLKIKCNNDDHAKNRRTEIRVLDKPNS